MSFSMNYVSEAAINSNLLCCICRMPFMNPVTARCSHTFCQDCITQAISHAPQCPVDRSALSLDDLVPANPIIRSLVDELIVECIHRTSGCTHTCQRQLLAAHIIDSCPYGRVACPRGECDQVLSRKDAESHTCVCRQVSCNLCGDEVEVDELETHIAVCSETITACEFCDLELCRAELVSHNISCPAVIIPCLHASNGCAWSGRRDRLASHIPLCSYEAIKGFFTLNSTKFERIAEENLILRHKVDTLENVVQTMKRELQSLKTAIGPWYRPDGVYSCNSPSSELPPDLQPSSASTSRRFSIGDSSQPNAAAPFDPGSQNIFAAFFPSETETQVETYVVDHGGVSLQNHPNRMPTHPASPGGWDHPHHTRPGSQHTVAPLNLSTTLEGSLAGVRESVVALGAAVDSLGRRNDIALTTEALRLNEEIMSLRANVHGLRMQVHAIMMDRNAQVTGRTTDNNLSAGDGSWPAHPRFFYPPTMPQQGGQSITKL